MQEDFDDTYQILIELEEKRDKIKEKSSQIKQKQAKIREEIRNMELEVQAHESAIKNLEKDDIAMKEARNQLTDSRNKELKSCCNNKKQFDQAKKLLATKLSKDETAHGVMNDLFRFCYGNEVKYNPKHRIMDTIDDFNTGIRAAEC